MADDVELETAAKVADALAAKIRSFKSGTNPPTPTPAPAPAPTPQPVPTPTPAPAAFLNRSTPDATKWKVLIEDDFTTLAPEGQFLKLYGDRWASAGDSGEYLTTSKQGHYDPNHLSVVDLPTGERVMQCRLTPRATSKDKHIGCGAQFKINGSGYNGTKGERIELRAKVLKPADNWHAANLGWPPNDNNWPKNGEPDFWESGLGSNDTVAGNIHVQNGGNNGEGQITLSSSVKVTDWFVVGFERVPGNYFSWSLNGQVVKTVRSGDLKSPYGIPNDFFRWMLQLEDSEDGTPTQECLVVYDWASLWVLR